MLSCTPAGPPVGGLSTGGALATWEALREDSPIDGGLFLFSAALDIYRKLAASSSPRPAPSEGSLRSTRAHAAASPASWNDRSLSSMSAGVSLS